MGVLGAEPEQAEQGDTARFAADIGNCHCSTREPSCRRDTLSPSIRGILRMPRRSRAAMCVGWNARGGRDSKRGRFFGLSYRVKQWSFMKGLRDVRETFTHRFLGEGAAASPLSYPTALMAFLDEIFIPLRNLDGHIFFPVRHTLASQPGLQGQTGSFI